MSYNDITDEELGKKLVELLLLKPNQYGLISTSWGDKNLIGLARSVMDTVDSHRILMEREY